MKKTIMLCLAMLLPVLAGTVKAGNPETKESEAVKNEKSHRVLVVRMDDNIISNYFTKDMLAEGTDISEDSICAIYNKVIENGLAVTANKTKSEYNFITGDGAQNGWVAMTKLARIEGEDDKATADLSTVNTAELRKLMDNAGASYLLVLDAHYMKYQEKPFKTLFHYVNYSLYDADKNKLGHGSNYFTSINPQNTAQMIKSSRKSTEKIVAMVEDTLN